MVFELFVLMGRRGRNLGLENGEFRTGKLGAEAAGDFGDRWRNVVAMVSVVHLTIEINILLFLTIFYGKIYLK